jgi:hypothetical protein
MKQPRLSLCLLFWIGLCGFVLCFPFALTGAEETPMPSATPAATGAAGISPTPSPTETPRVRWVGVHNRKEQRDGVWETYAQRGDKIWVDIVNFKDWVNKLEKKPDDHQWKDLILYLNHIPLDGVSPIYSYDTPNQWTDKGKDGSPPVEYTLTTVGFPLVLNDKSKPGWSHVLNQPVFKRRVIVSVGFPSGEEIPSDLTLDKVTGKDQQFYLTVIPPFRSAFGLIVILGALIAFLALARYTHIIRDATAPRRPDGLRPYSLARGQMAFWFFLVIASYFFLWIVTGDMDTLNTSVLALIGISAGTALGSAFVDAAKPVSVGSPGNQPIVDVTRPHLEVLAELTQLRADTQKELEVLQKARTLISPSDKQALDDNERQQNEVRERLANYRWQSAYFAWPTWKGVMYDLLAENNLISFHRFQIFVWTLVLGIMFVANVYNELAMPQFSATLLGLLGISAGTYVGFKLPESKAQ